MSKDFDYLKYYHISGNLKIIPEGCGWIIMKKSEIVYYLQYYGGRFSLSPTDKHLTDLNKECFNKVSHSIFCLDDSDIKEINNFIQKIKNENGDDDGENKKN